MRNLNLKENSRTSFRFSKKEGLRFSNLSQSEEDELKFDKKLLKKFENNFKEIEDSLKENEKRFKNNGIEVLKPMIIYSTQPSKIKDSELSYHEHNPELSFYARKKCQNFS